MDQVEPAYKAWEVTTVNYFRQMKNLLLIALVVAVFIVLNSFDNTEEADVPFPQEYNSWQLIKATVKDTISKATYANPKAIVGLTTGIFAEGSKIVFEVWYNQANSDGSKRRVKLDLMQKFDSGFEESNGWMFAHFKDNSQVNDVKTIEANLECFSCHKKQDNNVFAELKQ